jgi:hypothetical protein
MISGCANYFFLLVIHLRQNFHLIVTFAHKEGRIPRKLSKFPLTILLFYLNSAPVLYQNISPETL